MSSSYMYLPSHVYIVVPFADGMPKPQAVQHTRWVCRMALLQGLTPIYPPLIYDYYTNPDEWSVVGEAISLGWMRKCERIWVSFPDDDHEVLDRISYLVLKGVLQIPESKRPPVQRIWQVEGRAGFNIQDLDTYEIRDLVRCNIDVGVLLGV